MYLIADPEKAKGRKYVLEEEKYNATNFMTLWEFDGVLQYTPLFYGWYSNSSSGGYKVPLAYFMTGLVVYGYSFVATLRKMAENSRTSKLSEKDDECIFTWKLFTAWDYMIGNAETAHNRVASIVMGFKEALLEEAEKKKDTRNWRVICIRVLINIVVIGLLTISVYIVVLVVKRSTDIKSDATFWRKNEIAMVMSLITFIFPMVFEVLGIFEQYHPRKQLRLQLGRIMVLNLVNLYSLIFALIDKIGDMTTELQTFKNLTEILNQTLSIDSYPTNNCYTVCSDNRNALLSANQISEMDLSYSDYSISDLVSNVTALMIANLSSTFNESYTDIYFLNTSLTNFVQDKVYDAINMTRENITIPINQNFNYTDLEYKFADYLTYILYSLQDYVNVTEFYSENNTDVSEKTTLTTWEAFSSTIFPFLLNNPQSSTTTSVSTVTTDISEMGRFDYDMTTLFEYPATTIQENITTESSNCVTKCDYASTPTENLEMGLNYTMKARFRSLCWETMFGQELISITVMDLIMTIIPALGMDFFRGVFVRVMNRCWCWDLEKKFPKYGDFKVAENILTLVNNQGMVWMGMFFCPGLVVLNVIKLYVTMYFKAWAVMTCNVPPEVIFRASRSNNFYYYLLLMMLFLCVLPVGYTIVWIKPSWHCGPFSKYQKIFHIFTQTIKNNVPEVVQIALDYIASPGIIIPLLVLLILIIYYLLSLTNSLREANEDLKIQLRRERTEERRKMFQLADRRQRGGSGESNELSNTPFNKWKKLLGNLPSAKSLDETPKQEAEDIQNKEEKVETKSKDFFSKLIKRALRKSSTSEEDGTDNEQHDSLPYDNLTSKAVSREMRPSFSWAASDFQNVARKALQLNKAKIENEENKRVEITDSKHVHINDKATLSNQNLNKNRNNSIKEVGEPSMSTEVLGSNIVSKKSMNRKNLDNFKKNSSKEPTRNESTTFRQDSESSIWSDGIPVITISKTESAENILSVGNEKNNDNPILSNENNKKNNQKFKPKIKCALKKQTTEIDEDTIRYFNYDLEKNISIAKAIKDVAEEDISDGINFNIQMDEEGLTDRSSSEDTEQKERGSADSILRYPRTKDNKE